MLSVIKDGMQAMLCPRAPCPLKLLAALIFKQGGKSTLKWTAKIKWAKHKMNAHNCMALKGKIILLIKSFLYEYDYY